MKNKNIIDYVILQILIFAYFYAIGILISNKNDIREWPEYGRILYALFSVVISTAVCIAYFKNDNDGTRK